MNPVPNPHLPFDEQDPLTLLAILIWGEARGAGDLAKQAVGCVVRNRVAYQGRFGRGFIGVCLKPYQFDCFLLNDPNREKLLTPVEHEGQAVWDACYAAAQSVYNGKLTDPTRNAVFYYSPPILAPPRVWGSIQEMLAVDGMHFFRITPTPGPVAAMPVAA